MPGFIVDQGSLCAMLDPMEPSVVSISAQALHRQGRVLRANKQGSNLAVQKQQSAQEVAPL